MDTPALAQASMVRPGAVHAGRARTAPDVGDAQVLHGGVHGGQARGRGAAAVGEA